MSSLVQIIACHLFGTKPISWPNAGLLLIALSGTYDIENFIKIQESPKEMLSANWQPFCFALKVLIVSMIYPFPLKWIILHQCNQLHGKINWEKETATPLAELWHEIFQRNQLSYSVKYCNRGKFRSANFCEWLIIFQDTFLCFLK